MKILSGTSNQKLSKDISKQLKLKLVNTNIKRFKMLPMQKMMQSILPNMQKELLVLIVKISKLW